MKKMIKPVSLCSKCPEWVKDEYADPSNLRFKWTISHYSEYPIYEPAEGGYYYAGRSLESVHVCQTRKQAIRHLNKVFNEMAYRSPKRKSDGVAIYGELIGEGEFWVMEPISKVGSWIKGWEPYC